jgi:hypothetical protein
MTVQTLKYSGRLVVTSCWCGIQLAIPDQLYKEATRTKSVAVYCPLGHEFVYGNTTEDRLKKEREKTARLTSELDQSESSRRALRGVVTKKNKQLDRVKAGVCPCCKRTFQNVARHMASQHPSFRGVA